MLFLSILCRYHVVSISILIEFLQSESKKWGYDDDDLDFDLYPTIFFLIRMKKKKLCWDFSFLNEKKTFLHYKIVLFSFYVSYIVDISVYIYLVMSFVSISV